MIYQVSEQCDNLRHVSFDREWLFYLNDKDDSLNVNDDDHLPALSNPSISIRLGPSAESFPITFDNNLPILNSLKHAV